jgi:hypothetical protein
MSIFDFISKSISSVTPLAQVSPVTAVPAGKEVIREDADIVTFQKHKPFLTKLFTGEEVSFHERKPEEKGEYLHQRGRGVPGEFTMYNPDPSQTDSSPKIMASGKPLYAGAIATSDYSMPLGTQVYIPELKKTFTVEDRMNRRYSPKTYGKTVFDIPTLEATSSDKQSAKQFGRQQMHFVIVGHDGRKETKAEPQS